MENFVVSARKYRPLGFEEVVGQEHITTTLKNAIDSNKLAQALLFCGPRGVGKTTCARIVARMINGFEEKAEVNSLNIFELDAASNNSVEDIRNLIDQVRYPPQYGKFKVYIIDEVHMLSNAAFNAFLKTLEEPPSYAIFILATTEKHKVIPTILSRCQIFDFNRIQISDISKQLKKIADREKIKTEEAALHLIAQKADGALRDALSIFDLMVTFSSGKGVSFQDVIKNLHILDYEYYFKVVDALLAENPTVPLLIFDEVLHKGFDGQNFIVGLSEHIRNLMVSQDARTVQLMEVPDSIKKKYEEQAKASPYALLLSWLSIANQCDINYKMSKSQRLLVELALMKMAHVKSVVRAPRASEQSEPAEAGLKKKILVTPPPDEVPSGFGDDAPHKPAAKKDPEGFSESKNVPVPHIPEGSGTEPKEKKPTQKTIPEIPKVPEAATTGVSQSPIQQTPTPQAAPVKSAKPKATPTLHGLFGGPNNVKVEKQPEAVVPAGPNEAVAMEKLLGVWSEFATLRKNQVAEYQILKRDFKFEHPVVLVTLTNPVEESLLDNFKRDLIQYLRDKLKNSDLTIATSMQETAGKKVVYTSKEKFEHLAEKNPKLWELKERLGLDWDI